MTDHDSAYEGLVDEDSHGQWAFGTSFDDPLAGVDTTVPDDVDLKALAAYCLMLGDDALISSQRLAEWSTRAPELEEEVALANVGLDLLGRRARQRRGHDDGGEVDLGKAVHPEIEEGESPDDGERNDEDARENGALDGNRS